jgi:hypothetical protein
MQQIMKRTYNVQRGIEIHRGNRYEDNGTMIIAITREINKATTPKTSEISAATWKEFG